MWTVSFKPGQQKNQAPQRRVSLPRTTQAGRRWPLSSIITSCHHCQRRIVAAALRLVFGTDFFVVVVDHSDTSFSSTHVWRLADLATLHLLFRLMPATLQFKSVVGNRLTKTLCFPQCPPTPVSQSEPQSQLLLVLSCMGSATLWKQTDLTWQTVLLLLIYFYSSVLHFLAPPFHSQQHHCRDCEFLSKSVKD